MSAEHPFKRLRKSPPSKPDDAHNRYLDTVTVGNLRIVLRYLSNRPQHKNWHASISPLSLYIALNVGGALARAASLEFHRMGGEHGIPLYLDDHDDAPICRSLVHRLPLHRLVLRCGGGQAVPDLLRGCGAELREFVYDAWGAVLTKNDICAIASHCKKLSWLAIHGNRVEGALAPIWRSIGSTLTRIHIACFYSVSGLGIVDVISVPDLVEHCVNLNHVEVEEVNHETADVLIALGSRIRVLTIVGKLIPSCVPWREVYRACTNLEAVHLGLDCTAKSIDVLSLMGTKLVSLKLHDLHTLPNLRYFPDLYNQQNPMPTEDRFCSVLSACSVLKEVELNVEKRVTEALLRKLFEGLKSVTKFTCIMSEHYVNPAKDIIDAVACNFKKLESLTIWTASLKGEDVDALVDLPRLKHVTLRPASFNISPSKQPGYAVEVVKRFKDCVQLVQLEIHDMYNNYRSPIIAEAAAMYGRRDFDMFIRGVQYRTW